MHQLYLLLVSESLHNTNPCLTSMRMEIIITVFVLVPYCFRNQWKLYPPIPSGGVCPGQVHKHDKALPSGLCPVGMLGQGQEQPLVDLAGLRAGAHQLPLRIRVCMDTLSHTANPQHCAWLLSLHPYAHPLLCMCPPSTHFFVSAEPSPKSFWWKLC